MTSKRRPRGHYTWYGRSEEERFSSYLVRDESTGCLVYAGYTTDRGHGLFKLDLHTNGTKTTAHRYAWLSSGRKLTKQHSFVLHDCPCGDNPACCEIEHLWAGSIADNNMDKSRKNKGSKGRRGLPWGVGIQTNGRFQARFRLNSTFFCLGTYDVKEEAGRVSADLRAKIINEWWESVIRSGRAADWRYK